VTNLCVSSISAAPSFTLLLISKMLEMLLDKAMMDEEEDPAVTELEIKQIEKVVAIASLL
jgi:hypothetical protein